MLLMAYLMAALSSVAQESSLMNTKLTLSPEIKSVEEHLKDLRARGFKINYARNQLTPDRPIRLVEESGTLQTLLKDILREQPIQIVEKNGAIYLARLKVIPPPPPEPKKGKNYIIVGQPF